MIGIGGNGRFHHSDEEGGYDDPARDFPLRDKYTDCAGREHTFEVSYYEAPLGFSVTAEEVGKEGLGYQFSAFDANSPYLALYSVRQKIRQTLATRYVERQGHPHHVPTHDVIRGRITAGEGEAIFVIDGDPLSLEEFSKLVCTNEGWEFELRFLDPA